MEKIGAIMQGGANLGANQIGNFQFTIDNKEDLKSQVREQAIEEAKEKAKILADQLDVRLIRIVNFNEGFNRPIMPRFDTMEPMIVKENLTPEIEIGEDEIQITVQITYEIR